MMKGEAPPRHRRARGRVLPSPASGLFVLSPARSRHRSSPMIGIEISGLDRAAAKHSVRHIWISAATACWAARAAQSEMDQASSHSSCPGGPTCGERQSRQGLSSQRSSSDRRHARLAKMLEMRIFSHPSRILVYERYSLFGGLPLGRTRLR